MRKGIVLIIALLMLAACNVTTAPPTQTPTPDVAAEESAVYAAAIQSRLGGVPELLVLADQTEVDIGGQLTETLEYVTQQLPGIAPDTLASFHSRNDRSYPLSPDLTLPSQHVLLSVTEEQALFSAEGGGWEAFYQRYPNAQGVMRLSRVGFNAAMTQAVVYVGNQSHWLAGAGFYYLLTKENGTWRVTGEVMVWIS